MQIKQLHRYAVKGLSGDPLQSVQLTSSSFPDDRRYALLKQKDRNLQADEDASPAWVPGQWMHKENFLCAFTAPELLASLKSSYRIVPPTNHEQGENDDNQQPCPTTRRLLELADRATGRHLLGPIEMQDEQGRQELADFLSNLSGQKVVCVTAGQEFQFGNTSSGVKQRKDSRTIHIINQATVDDLSEKIGVALNPARFRPNIVIDGVDAWEEFDWVDEKQTLEHEASGLRLTVINKTVRCKGVSVDPSHLGDPKHVLDIPELLIKHFPQHGPFLGVYAVVDEPGHLNLGDSLRLLN